jgi:hypothetical protein
MMLGLKLMLTEDLLDQLGEEIFQYNTDNEFIQYEEDQLFMNALPEFVDEKTEEKITSALFRTGEFERPKDLDYTLMLTDLKMIWDRRSQTYRNVGGKTGVVYIGKKSINQKIKAYIEFGLKRSSDYFDIYFETPMDDWYYFSYKNDQLRVISSSEKFNKALLSLPPQKRRFRDEETNEALIFLINSTQQKNKFISRMRYYEEGE